MSSPGLVIDPVVFTRDGQEIHKALEVVDFERLAAAVLRPAGRVDFDVRGWRDAERRMWLDLQVRGTLLLQCQRCLGEEDWTFDISNRLLLVPEGGELPDDELQEDDWDAVPVAARLDLRSLIEDEVLLALPIAPRHEDCKTPTAVGGGNEHSPFAALAKLRGGGKA